jgi:two-component system, response regulator YesN
MCGHNMNERNIVKLNNQNIVFSQKLPFKIRKAIKYIEKNYMNPDLCLKEIAKSVNMHPKSFSFLWNKWLEINMPDFINDIRITNAKRLLIRTADYTSQIAHKVGFNFYHFNRVFKVKIGIPPNQYRNSYPSKYPM